MRLARRFLFTPLLLLPLALAGCSGLFYQPAGGLYSDPYRAHPGFEQRWLRAADETLVCNWYFPAEPPAPHRGVVVQFHGNAENMTSHYASLVWLTREGYDLLAFDYRGYGITRGVPTQAGVHLDALAAIRGALARAHAEGDLPVTLYGQSLGGAILLRAYGDLTDEERRHVRAVVVESTFDSYRAIARDMLARHWVTFLFQPLAYVLVSDAYSPADWIARVSPTPLLVIHGDQDPVIPLEFGRRIYARASEPKQLYVIPGGGHLEAPPAALIDQRRAVLRFLAEPNGAAAVPRSGT